MVSVSRVRVVSKFKLTSKSVNVKDFGLSDAGPLCYTPLRPNGH